MSRRASHSAGEPWAKWEKPLMLKPWLEYKANMAGYWLICISIGALLALAVK